MTALYADPSKRHDAVLLIEVVNGNPNGDPDNSNLPRTNPYDGTGLITDVAIKRKIRNWVAAARPDADPGNARYKIYVEEGVALNGQHRRAYVDLESRHELDKADLDDKKMKTPKPAVALKCRRT